MAQETHMAAAGGRPNLVLITTDGQRFDTINAAGNRSIFTPHLNWLCDTGIRYSRAYAECPSRGPARGTLMTGVSALGQGTAGPTLAERLAAGGYQTHAVGDVDGEAAGRPHAHGLGATDMEPVITPAGLGHTRTYRTVKRSIEFLEGRDAARPFFLWAGFDTPGPPFDPPAGFWEIYDGIPLPEPLRGDWSERDADVDPALRLASGARADRFSPAQLRNIARAYYACVSHLDYSLGLLFARLRALGLLENTCIALTSTRGEMLGDHGLGGASVFLEGAAHVPLLLRTPASGRAGETDDRLASLADVMPTFLSLAGVSSAGVADDLNLLAEPGRETLFGQCGALHAAIDGHTKYTFSELGGGELLFDLSNDPAERWDLAPTDVSRLGFMRALLNDALTQRGHAAAGPADRPVPTGPALRR